MTDAASGRVAPLDLKKSDTSAGDWSSTSLRDAATTNHDESETKAASCDVDEEAAWAAQCEADATASPTTEELTSGGAGRPGGAPAQHGAHRNGLDRQATRR